MFSFIEYLRLKEITQFLLNRKIRVWSMVKRTIHPIAIGEMDKIGYSCAYSSSNRTILVG